MKTKIQNINGHATVCMLDFNDYGTIIRALKHRVLPNPIAMLKPTNEHVGQQHKSNRIVIYKYVDLTEIRLLHKLPEHVFDELSNDYKNQAFGQVSLFF